MIDGKVVVIEMQQWNKLDVVKRFYTYHCVNTSLLLEKLPLKSIPTGKNEEVKFKDYEDITNVITIVWMVNDNMNMEEDFVSYIPLPEISKDFVLNKELWRDKKNYKKVLEYLERIYKIYENDTRDLDFLQENKLIFVFQKNIIENKKNKSYYKWFKFASETLREDNKKEDFKNFKKNSFLKIIKKLKKDFLNDEEIKAIKDTKSYLERVNRFKKSFLKLNKRELTKAGIKIGREEGREEGQKEKAIEIAKQMKNKNISNEDIANMTKLSMKEVENII